MKVIIAGSRNAVGSLWKRALLNVMVEFEAKHGPVTTVISGTAKGMDSIGEAWAKWKNVPVVQFAPDWEKHGRGAGPKRNALMAAEGEALVCLHDGGPGSADMMRQARKKGMPVVEVDMRAPAKRPN